MEQPAKKTLGALLESCGCDTLVTEAEYQGRKVKLNKPFRTPGESKKFAVYVKGDNGNVRIVRFGDPNMEIRRDNPERRKAFNSRHNCDTATDRTTARYWSCKWGWGSKSVRSLDEWLQTESGFLSSMLTEIHVLPQIPALSEDFDRDSQTTIDTILDKISKSGIQSLTAYEKEILDKSQGTDTIPTPQQDMHGFLDKEFGGLETREQTVTSFGKQKKQIQFHDFRNIFFHFEPETGTLSLSDKVWDKAKTHYGLPDNECKKLFADWFRNAYGYRAVKTDTFYSNWD